MFSSDTSTGLLKPPPYERLADLALRPIPWDEGFFRSAILEDYIPW